MLQHCLILVACVVLAGAYPYPFETSQFRVGIEYDHSIPMNGGSDRYRHRNNYDPFFVTITATAKNGFVITYLDVTATVDALGQIDFNVVRGSTGSKSMTFQLVSNNSDFLSYTYLAYGIRDEEYKKISNIITLPIGSNGLRLHSDGTMVITCLLAYTITLLYS